jgi:hypothetical protein
LVTSVLSMQYSTPRLLATATIVGVWATLGQTLEGPPPLPPEPPPLLDDDDEELLADVASPLLEELEELEVLLGL